jgi:hypothetical protein
MFKVLLWKLCVHARWQHVHAGPCLPEIDDVCHEAKHDAKMRRADTRSLSQCVFEDPHDEI